MATHISILQGNEGSGYGKAGFSFIAFIERQISSGWFSVRQLVLWQRLWAKNYFQNFRMFSWALLWHLFHSFRWTHGWIKKLRNFSGRKLREKFLYYIN